MPTLGRGDGGQVWWWWEGWWWWWAKVVMVEVVGRYDFGAAGDHIYMRRTTA